MTTQEKRGRGRPVGSGEEVLQRMQNIVDFIRDYNKEHGIAPTLMEITAGVGQPENDFANIQRLVQKLIAEGFLVNNGAHHSRTLRVAKKPPRKFFYKSNGGE